MISRQGRQWPVGAGIAINSPDCHKQAQGLVRLADCLQTSCTRCRTRLIPISSCSPGPADHKYQTVGRIQIKFLPPAPSLATPLSPDLIMLPDWFLALSRQHKLESPSGTKKVTWYFSWLQLHITSLNLQDIAWCPPIQCPPAILQERQAALLWVLTPSCYRGGGRSLYDLASQPISHPHGEAVMRTWERARGSHCFTTSGNWGWMSGWWVFCCSILSRIRGRVQSTEV